MCVNACAYVCVCVRVCVCMHFCMCMCVYVACACVAKQVESWKEPVQILRGGGGLLRYLFFRRALRIVW